MCGIVGAVSTRNIVPILVEGLQRLEYRGYDSCGVAVHQAGGLQRARSTSRVAELQAQVARRRHRRPAPASPTRAGPRTARRRCTTRIRISRHGPGADAERSPARRASRWSTTASSRTTTSCAPSCRPRATRSRARPTPRSSPTWSTSLYDGDLFEAVQRALPRLRGAYAIAVFCRDEPHRVVGARAGSPLVLGVGTGRRRELPRLRRDGAGRRHRPDRLPRRGRRRRPAARQVLDQPADATAATSRVERARCAPCMRAQRRRRARPVPPLHAEGDLRAAARDRRHARRRRRHLARAVRRRRATASSRRSTRC